MNIKKITACICSVCFTFQTFIGVNAQKVTPDVKTGNSTVTISGTVGKVKNDFVTVALVDSAVTDEIKGTDIGYVGQYKLNFDGSYDITFPFDGFQFDGNGNVSNYKLYMHIAGESITPEVARVNENNVLSAMLYVSKGATVASIIADISNILGETDGKCTMIISAYSGDGRLLGVIKDEKTVSFGKTERKYLDMELPEGTTYVKGFVWNNISGMIPIYEGDAAEKIFGGYDFESETEAEDWFWFGAVNNVKTIVERTTQVAYEGQGSIRLYSQADWCSMQSKQLLLPLLSKGNGSYKITAYVMPEEKDALLTTSITTRTPAGSYSESKSSDAETLKAGVWNKLEQTLQVNLTGIESEAFLEFTTTGGFGQNIYLDNIMLEPVEKLNPVADTGDMVKLYMVGDSRCTNYTFDETANTIQGWGTYLCKSFDDTATALNCATGGYDTSDFIYGETAEWGEYGERWSTIHGLADENDYVMICLGANDYFHGFTKEKYLKNIKKMINDVKAKGAIPILVTPCPIIGDGSNGLSDFWDSNDKLVRNDSFSNLVNSLKTIDDVILLDMRETFMNYIEEVGREYTENTLYVSDKIHLSHIGAKKVSDIIIELMKAEPKLSALEEVLN